MNESIFIDWVKKYFPKLSIEVSKNLTEGENAPKYFHLEMLNKKYSDDGSWESIAGDYTNVAADIVPMDSKLDVKKRDAVKTASGDIPKVGMSLYLTEKQLKVLDSLVARNQIGVTAGKLDNEIIKALFSDLKRCEQGVYERNEKSFLQALSHGYILTDDDKDASMGVRVNMKYPEENQLQTGIDWSNADTAKPISDIDDVLEANPSIKYIMLQSDVINQMRRSKEVIQEVASANGQVVLSDSTLGSVSKSVLIQYLADEKNLELIEVKRKVTIEKDGVRTITDPWNKGVIVFLSDKMVGDLVWSRVAEMNHQLDNVEYQIVDDFILMSKYRETNPLREMTASQAMVTPIITQINGVFLFDTKKK